MSIDLLSQSQEVTLQKLSNWCFNIRQHENYVVTDADRKFLKEAQETLDASLRVLRDPALYVIDAPDDIAHGRLLSHNQNGLTRYIELIRARDSRPAIKATCTRILNNAKRRAAA